MIRTYKDYAIKILNNYTPNTDLNEYITKELNNVYHTLRPRVKEELNKLLEQYHESH